MSDRPVVVLFGLHCPACEWTRTDPVTEVAALEIAGAHDDTRHRGEPTIVLVVVLTDPTWPDVVASDPPRAAALLAQTVTHSARTSTTTPPAAPTGTATV